MSTYFIAGCESVVVRRSIRTGMRESPVIKRVADRVRLSITKKPTIVKSQTRKCTENIRIKPFTVLMFPFISCVRSSSVYWSSLMFIAVSLRVCQNFWKNLSHVIYFDNAGRNIVFFFCSVNEHCVPSHFYRRFNIVIHAVAYVPEIRWIF